MLEYYRFKTVSDLFLKGRIEEARLELAELQRRYVALCDENTTFKMQVQEYEDILYLARNLVQEEQFYWLITGSIKQGPFCPHCYRQDGLLMRLSIEGKERYCPNCKESFVTQPGLREACAGGRQDFVETELVRLLSEKPVQRAKVIPFNR